MILKFAENLLYRVALFVPVAGYGCLTYFSMCVRPVYDDRPATNFADGISFASSLSFMVGGISGLIQCRFVPISVYYTLIGTGMSLGVLASKHRPPARNPYE